MKKSQHMPFSKDSLWAIVSNTERTNRVLRFSPVEYDEAELLTGKLTRTASSRMFGMKAVWTEFPFEWENKENLSVTRLFSAGVFSALRLAISLQESQANTLVVATVKITPRSPLFWPLAFIASKVFLKRLFEFIERSVLDEGKRGSTPSPIMPASETNHLTPTQSRLVETGLAKVQQSLKDRPNSKPIIATFENLVRFGDDGDLVAMRPYEFAARWNVDRRETARVFFESTKHGLLDATWSVMCPTCRVGKGSSGGVSDLPESVHCRLCGIDFESDLAGNVELRFDLHPSVRTLDQREYCIGSPSRRQHTLVQIILEPGACRMVKASHQPSLMTVRCPGVGKMSTFSTGTAGTAVPRFWSFSGTEWVKIPPESLKDGAEHAGKDNLAARLGGSTNAPRFLLRNDSDKPIVAVLEDGTPDRGALTGIEVLLFEDYARLFGATQLAAGRGVAVRRIAILFTDLVGSTAMYERIGDAAAFSRVQKHFEFLSEIFHSNRGRIIKTIGDAVMAVFPEAQDAVRAALQVQSQMDNFNKKLDGDAPIRLRIGVHQGAAVAVGANERIDYFGRTINIASRVEHEGEPGAVIVSPEIAQDDDVAVLLRAAEDLVITTKEASLKGIEGFLTLSLVRPKSAAASEDVGRAQLRVA